MKILRGALVLLAVTLTGCMSAEQAARWNAAAQAGLDGVNQSLQAHPPLQLPPSPCYPCRR